jgi:hypothetical protein
VAIGSAGESDIGDWTRECERDNWRRAATTTDALGAPRNEMTDDRAKQGMRFT